MGNVLANVCQFSSRLDVPEDSKLLGCLPLFHSFGATVTLWFPVIEGVDLVTYPNPIETKRLGELIVQHGVNILLATPTFLRGYMKRVEPEQLPAEYPREKTTVKADLDALRARMEVLGPLVTEDGVVLAEFGARGQSIRIR